MNGCSILKFVAILLIGECVKVIYGGETHIDQESTKSVKELIERFENSCQPCECTKTDAVPLKEAIDGSNLSIYEATKQLYESIKHQDSSDRCIRLHLFTMFLSDDGGISPVIVKSIAEQEILKSDAPTSFVERLTRLKEYVENDSATGEIVAEIEYCLDAAHQAPLNQRAVCQLLQEQDNGGVELGKNEIYSEAFKMMSDLNDVMERVDYSKRLMLKGEVPFRTWINLLREMKQKLEHAPDSIPLSYRAFLARQLSDLRQMKHCDDLMNDVIKLERDGIINESAITDWNIMILSIIRYSSIEFSCPPNVRNFLEDKKRCAKSDLRETFVSQALELVRAKSRQQVDKARYKIITTITNCQRDNISMPAWYPKLYNSIVP